MYDIKILDRFKLLFSIVSLGLCVFGAACSSTQVNEKDPASLYQDAVEEVESEHYQIALEKLRAIKNKFPYSSYAVDAQLKIADVYFIQELYAEAAGAYESFRDLHPKHEKASYAMYQIGRAYFNDTPRNVARDLSSAQKTIDTYSDFVRRFPEDPRVKEAKEDIQKVRELLAAKEIYIGDFYLKRDFDDSAKPRYQKVIELYPETQAAQVAAEKIAKIEERAQPKPEKTEKPEK